VVHGALQRQARARLNIISHMLTRIPYKDITRDEVVKLPKRGKIGKYKAVPYPFKSGRRAFLIPPGSA
jgi:hypothetical protein